MNIQHSSRTDEWSTPAHVISMIHDFFGRPPDLDPASSEFFNRVVRAKTILTREDNALECAWPEADYIFLNPPGGKLKNKSMTGLFWNRLIANRDKFKEAIFLGFSLEALQVTQKYSHMSILDFPFCVPKSRLRFGDCYGNEGKAPSHSNVLVYVPGNDVVSRHKEFGHKFKSLGACTYGRR